MRRWQTKIALLAAGAVSAGACSSVTYSEDFDRQARFGSSGTYTWQEPTQSQRAALDRINPFLQRRVRRAVEVEMSHRGFRPSTGRRPDLRVSAYPILPAGRSGAGRRAPGRSRVAVGIGVGFWRPYGYRYAYPYGHRLGFGYPYAAWSPFFDYWSPYAWFGTPGRGAYRPYFGTRRARTVGSGDRGPGTLVIEVRDGRSGNVLWQGWADGALLDMPAAGELEAYVSKVVGRIMRDFPPPEDSG